MTEPKLNPELMHLNQQQLSGQLSRREIRRQRRELLEKVLFDQAEETGKAKNRHRRHSSWLWVLVVVSLLAALSTSFLFLR